MIPLLRRTRVLSDFIAAKTILNIYKRLNMKEEK
jgi:hypothetical protein